MSDNENDIMDFLEDLLESNWKLLRFRFPNVINIGIGKKIIEGKETDQLCLIFYVSKKVDAKLLAPNDLIPKEIGGACTDVQPLQADYVIGETEPSLRDRKTQKLLAGGVKKR